MAMDSTEAGSDPIPDGTTILVVDDDERTSRLERFVLEEQGYLVACAVSGEEALEMMATTAPSLILLDIRLPKMDGFITCQKIRENSQVPIIMLTGEGRDEEKIRGLEMGADDYITKPFSVTELTARVKAVLRRSESRRSKTVSARTGSPQPDMSLVAVQTGEAQTGEAQTGEAQTGEAQTGEAQTGEAQTGEAQTGEAQTGEEQTVEAQTGEAQTGEAQTGEEQTVEAQTGEAQTGEEQTGEEQTGEEQTGEEQTEKEQTGEEGTGTTVGKSDDISEKSSGQDEEQPVDEDYEGAVKLIVETTGAIKDMVDFVDTLREHPQFHLLRMVSNARRDGMDVWLRLREPNPLRTTLLAAKGVTKVEAVKGAELDSETGAETRVLKVSLN